MFKPTDKESLVALKVDAPDAADLKVLRLDGFDGISTLFEFRCQLVSTRDDIDLQGMLGKKVTLAIRSTPEQKPAYYHGIFCEFEQQERTAQYCYYQAVFVPRLWLHQLNQVNDVYTKVELADLLEKKLKETVFSSQDFTIDLTNALLNYPQRPFVAQFEESNFQFLSRTMERYGIYYFFDHGDSDTANEIIKIVDNKRSHPDEVMNFEYAAVDSAAVSAKAGLVTDLVCRVRAQPASVTLTGYNPSKAGLQTQMRDQRALPGQGYGDVMAFDGVAEDDKALQRLNAVRAEELACQLTQYTAKSRTAGIRSGHLIKLTKHFRASFNAEFLVTRVRHSATQTYASLGMALPAGRSDSVRTSYECEFDAILSDTQFRPPRTTPRPRIPGLLNAKVDGSDLVNIDNRKSDVFDNGTYKVQPLFLKDDKTHGNGSDLLRMLTPYSGDQSGFQFGLRRGAEVLLAFINGDPDLPIIVGAAFNSEDNSVVGSTNKSEHVIKTHSGAMLVFDDTAGREKMTIYNHGSSIIIGRDAKGILASLTDDLLNM